MVLVSNKVAWGEGKLASRREKEKPHTSRQLLELVFGLFTSLVFKPSPSDHQNHSSLNWPRIFFSVFGVYIRN